MANQRSDETIGFQHNNQSEQPNRRSDDVVGQENSQSNQLEVQTDNEAIRSTGLFDLFNIGKIKR